MEALEMSNENGLLSDFGLYSIYDKMADRYSAPNMAVNDAVASRMFGHEMTKVAVSPDDYELYKLGEFSSITGEISLCAKRLVLSGEQVMEKYEK